MEEAAEFSCCGRDEISPFSNPRDPLALESLRSSCVALRERPSTAALVAAFFLALSSEPLTRADHPPQRPPDPCAKCWLSKNSTSTSLKTFPAEEWEMTFKVSSEFIFEEFDLRKALE